MGYYGVFLGLQYYNDVEMVKVLDADEYAAAETLTIAIPISIPYMSDNVDFERVDGKFEYQGNHYRLVKQKYAKDTLTVVCVRDYGNEKISDALSTYVKTFTDKCADQSKKSKITISFIKDFLPETFCLATTSAGWEMDVVKHGFNHSFIPTFVVSVIHPPERA